MPTKLSPKKDFAGRPWGGLKGRYLVEGAGRPGKQRSFKGAVTRVPWEIPFPGGPWREGSFGSLPEEGG